MAQGPLHPLGQAQMFPPTAQHEAIGLPFTLTPDFLFQPPSSKSAPAAKEVSLLDLED